MVSDIVEVCLKSREREAGQPEERHRCSRLAGRAAAQPGIAARSSSPAPRLPAPHTTVHQAFTGFFRYISYAATDKVEKYDNL